MLAGKTTQTIKNTKVKVRLDNQLNFSKKLKIWPDICSFSDIQVTQQIIYNSKIC
jgi:hypothetical protein